MKNRNIFSFDDTGTSSESQPQHPHVVKPKVEPKIQKSSGPNRIQLNNIKSFGKPTPLEINLIREFNNRKSMQMPLDQQSGHSIALGKGAHFLTTTVFQSTMIYLYKQPQQTQLDDLHDVLTGNKQLSDIILSQQTRLQIKRILTLFVILFDFSKCGFKFMKSQSEISIVKRNTNPEENKQEQLFYLKNWIQWVINLDCLQKKTIQLPIQKINCKLALRKTEQLANAALQNQLYDQAEFLSNIEDEYYRSMVKSQDLPLELQRIVINDFKGFQNQHWLIKLGVLLWYYNFNEEDNEQEIIKILFGAYQEQQYSRELFLLELSLVKYSSVNIPFHKQALLEWDWYMMNKLPTKEQERIKQAKNYRKYHYFLTHNLIKSSNQSLFFILEHDKYLTPQDKQNIMNSFMKKYYEQQQRQEEPIFSNRNQYLKILDKYDNQNYLQALQLFQEYIKAKIQLDSSNFIQFIQELLCNEELLCSFSNPMLHYLYSTLDNIIDTCSKDLDTLEIIYFYLGVRLNILNIGDRQIYKIEGKKKQRMKGYHKILKQKKDGMIIQQGNYKIDKLLRWSQQMNKSKKMIQDSIFQILILDPQIMKRIRNQEQFRVLLEEIYRKDKHKLVQLKQAKLYK